MNKLVSLSIKSLLILSCAIIFNTCQKEYSCEGGLSNCSTTGTAVYTLNGTGGACAGSVLTGKYYKAIPLTSDNTVQLQVDVTTIGTYILNTNTANGFYFSASGTFTTTGIQTITLTCSGTPAAAGNFIFTPSVFVGCSFTIPVIPVPQAVASFTLSGEPNSCISYLISGRYLPGIPLNSSNSITIGVNVTVAGAYKISTDTLDGISFSASGTFTTTGNQKVDLIGSGIPVLPRYLLFTPSAATSHCTFDITVSNPEPVATYVLESNYGTPNPCVYTLYGTYLSNTSLSVSDTVSMRVYVTVAGNFTIATNIVNGMMFSYTGTFTKTGFEYVTLEGSGIPVSKGMFTYSPEIIGPHPLGGETCAFAVTVQ